MKIAIHNAWEFAEEWIKYCQDSGYDYKIVNCYDNDIIEQLKDCDALMWRYHHISESDGLFAKELLFAVEQSGKKVFPNFNTSWHYDDKIGQKYLFESLSAPFVPTYIFYNEKEAINWVNHTTFPKVFKLRNGAGSANVRLVKTRRSAINLIKTAFGKGFRHQRSSWNNFKEKWWRYKIGNANIKIFKSAIKRFLYVPIDERRIGVERNYVYFQDFISDNDSDTRVIVIGDKAFAIKRMVRENDFRASGSGVIDYRKEVFEDRTINLAFELADKIKSQSAAFDFVFCNGEPLVVEISYSFSVDVYRECEGYWDRDLKWNPGPFNPYAWMVDLLF